MQALKTTTTSGRAGRNLAQMLRAGLLGITLMAGLIGVHEAAAAPQKKAAPAAQSDHQQGKDPDSKQQDNSDHADELPTITLTAPAAGSASLYPAAFSVAASVTFPGKAARHDKREGVEIEFLANGVKFVEVEHAPYQASYVPPQAGRYTFSARIRYGEGRRSIVSNAVDVVSDLPPTVALTAPANNTVITAPATFTLNANATAPIGSIAKVEFYNGATLIGTATQAPYSYTWTNVPAGTYSLSAKATDNYGFSTSSGPVAVISNAAPTVNITAPANNAVVAAPGSFTFTASAADVDGTVAKVEFYNGTTLIGTATAAPYSYTWNSVPAGIYTITARATDNYGASTTSAPISVIADTPPTVNLTAPAANAVSTAPGSFTLSATAASSMSTIAKVDFYNGTTLIGTATQAPYSYTWSNVPAGSYSLTAKATDGYGIAASSGTVAVISNAAPAVSITAPATNSSYTTPANITLTANATDADGSIATVSFYADNAGTSTLIGTATTGTAGAYSVTWNNAPAGNSIIVAVATDNLGAQATATVSGISVIAPPVVSLATNKAVSIAPGSFTLTATASSAGTIARVEFYATTDTTNTSTLVGTATTAAGGVYSTSWANVPAGSYSLTAVATDGNGASTISTSVAVIADALPTISLTSPAANASVTAPGSFTLTADAASSTSTIAQVDFYTDGTLIGTATQAPYSYTWSNVPAGSYSLTAKATDVFGTAATSAAVSVTVKTGVAQAYYIQTDHLNTPKRITDSNGNVVWDNSDPFGNSAPNGNPAGLGQFENPLRFPGQYFDRETNTNYNYFRDYDPATGRYIQSDPIGLAGGINTYAYANGNPISHMDPTGLVTQCEMNALREIINQYGLGPKVGPNDITTDSTRSRGFGHQNFSGPIVIHTNPAESLQFSGSVVDRNMSELFVETGIHENYHQSQGLLEHALDGAQELATDGETSWASEAAANVMKYNPSIVRDFLSSVKGCGCQR